MPKLNLTTLAKSIAFIDSQVDDYQSLVAGVKPGTEVVILDAGLDAIEQITEILAARNNIDSIHIISHGSPGSLQIGKTKFSLDNLEIYSRQLRQWRSAFTDSAEILIYGCNVAAGHRVFPEVHQEINSLSHSASRLKPTASHLNIQQSFLEDLHFETEVFSHAGTCEQALELDGFAFIQHIAKLTNTNVAASKNLTGSAAQGGDWELETRTGEIKTPLVFEPEILANYEYVLNFGTATNFPVTYSLRKVATGDFNKDSNLDLAFASTGPNRNVSIVLGNGNGTFGAVTNLNTNSPSLLASWSVAVGDFNKDGNSDLVTANNFTNNVSLLLGNGDGTFGTATYFDVGSSPYTVAVGDFNSDSNFDLVTANRGSNNISILLGGGSGNFSAPINLSVGSNPYFVLVGDLNKDGRSDFATANFSSNSVSIILRNPNESFGNAINFPVGENPNYIALGDFNGDSNPDLATSNEGSNNVSILLGNGAGSFSAATNFNVGTDPLAIVANDFNIDGNIDLATANNLSNDVSVLLGNGNGTFGTATNFSVGTYPQGIAIGDFNKDGLRDLATANFGSVNTSILLNATPKVNFGAATYSGTEGTADFVVNIPVTISNSPSSEVRVPIAVNSNSTATPNSDYTFSPTTITFPVGTTNLTQNVAVTIKPDNIAENDETIIFNFGTITGSLAGTTTQTTLTIPANGQISYAIATDVPSIKEGNTATTLLLFTVIRSGDIGGQSSVDYTIGGTATNDSDYNNIGGTSGATGLTGTIDFAANETSKTITLNLLGDAAVEADETIAVTLSNPVAPGIPPRIANATATTTIANDDKAGINVIPLSAINLTEGGVAGSYAATLTSQPAAPVTISLNAGDRIDRIAAITFNSNNWNVPQTISVSAIDDNIVQGVLAGTIAYEISSADPNYNSLTIADVTIPIGDNDRAGVSIVQSAGSTEIGESGATDTYSLVLDSEPVAPVTINFNSGTQINPIAPVIFTPQNWNVPQNVTVSAIDDNLSEGTHSGTISHTVSSTDANYNDIIIPNVTASIADNDRPGVSIIESAGSTKISEGGATDTYSLVLISPPTAPVTINFDSSTQINAIAPVTFTPNNWNVPQNVTVSAIDDNLARGNYSGTIAHTISSTDANYNGLLIPPVTVAIADSDTAGITISTTKTTATEGGITGSYSIKLNSQPIAPVTISFNTGSLIDPIAAITIDSTNWNIAQTITVIATDDNFAGGNGSSNIFHTVTSTDANYNGIAIPRVAVEINDNEIPPAPIPALNPAPNPSPNPLPTPTPEIIPAPNPTNANQTAATDCICRTILPPNLDRPNEINNILYGNGSNIEQFGTTENDASYGSINPNIFYAEEGNDNLFGGTDNDSVNGNEGDDFIVGNWGGDLLFGGKNSDTILGDRGADLVFGNQGSDFINGREDNDSINGNRDADWVDGGKGDDSLLGGKDNDSLTGSEGSDSLLGNLGDDTLCGGGGDDYLRGDFNNDLIDGGAGDDRIYGGENDDTLIGCEGDDILLGDKGDDLLTGGLGNDTLTGGDGVDRFLLFANAGNDTITDFEDGTDLLVLGNVTFSQLAIVETNGITQISFVPTGQVFANLIGISADRINAADFTIL
ncbi:MAG: DUF4347 domain-containing protein [Oscillatoriaceae cyanobacterium Prado104]|jgi:hypothetical protein|nr:DUF4347 domain-containing protein [Oscillatoriaceae cyanobacterium Prado104]